jgi:hypothetical protein
VKRGGGVIWLAGDELAAARWRGLENAIGAASSDAALPTWRWRAIEVAAGSPHQIRSTQGESITAWSGVRVQRRWTFDRTAASPERSPVPLDFADQQPLTWSWRPWGGNGGRVSVVNVGADRAWSDAAGTGAFAALAHAVVSASVGGGASVRSAYNVPNREVDLRSDPTPRGIDGQGDAGNSNASRDSRAARLSSGSTSTIVDSDARAIAYFPLFLAAAIFVLMAESLAAQPTGVQRV